MSALKESVRREGAAWAENSLGAFGARAGSADYLELGALANKNPPELDTHDRYGRRIDLVRFHPSYHALMKAAIEEGIHSSPWTEPREGAHVARAARSYMQSQVEAGHGCPITMTFASVPCLEGRARSRRGVAAEGHRPRLRSPQRSGRPEAGRHDRDGDDGETGRLGRARQYDPRHSGRRRGAGTGLRTRRPQVFRLRADVRRVSRARPGAGRGLSCFLVPRWRPDGTKNPLQIVRLKRKMGNVSNASSETELRGALGWMVGPEGRGVTTIIEMVAMTRFDCMIGSSAGMRMAVSQAIDHCRQRKAFGALLDRSADHDRRARRSRDRGRGGADADHAPRRARSTIATTRTRTRSCGLGTAIGKYWICKRAPGHAYEALECIGGSGVMEDSPMPRLYREAPVNAIWEGSGNVQCLDIARAISRSPADARGLFRRGRVGEGR